MRLDATAMRDILERAVAEHGVVSTWDTVLRPVLAGIGERHAATERLIEVEHLFSRTATEVLGVRAATAPAPRPARILLACADEEQHSLPLEALAAALAENGRDLAGCSAPACRVGALADAVERTGPAAVVVWSQASGHRRPRPVARAAARPAPADAGLAGGPGWRADELPAGVALPTSLTEAVRLRVGCLRWRPSASVEAVRPAPAPRSTPMRSRITVAAALAVLTVLVGVRWAMTRDVPATVPVVVAAPSGRAAARAPSVAPTASAGRRAGPSRRRPRPPRRRRSPTSRAARSGRSARAG